jgi:PTS system nitrogen regulatory IIA component
LDLRKHIAPDQILVGVEASDKWELLDRMIAAIGRSPVVTGQPEEVRSRIGALILEREREQSSGLTHGLAYPHARVPGFRGFVASLAILKTELEYGTLDHIPVRLVFMAVTPLETPMIGMQTMSLFAGLMSDSATRDFLLAETNPAAAYDFLVQQARDLELVVVARQLMHPLKVFAAPDTPLQTVTRMMHEHEVDAMAVLDGEGKIVGEITSDLLFKKGLPDFFSQLTSVAFIRYYDPFETYFENEARAAARDIMSSDFAAVTEETTLMEIVFLLSVRRYPKIYVVRDGKVVGMIDRAAVVDRILNL